MLTSLSSSTLAKRVGFVAPTDDDSTQPENQGLLDEQQQEQLILDIKIQNDRSNTNFKVILSALSAILCIFFILIALSTAFRSRFHIPDKTDTQSSPHAYIPMFCAISIALSVGFLHSITGLNQQQQQQHPQQPPSSSIATHPLFVSSVIFATAALIMTYWSTYTGATLAAPHLVFWTPVILCGMILSVASSIREVENELVGLERAKYKFKGA
ncbi:hypothetical protein HDU76_013692 [Blyttiomyces sp. JEL0837]|nr:hypothetical protein HDU76_013692 [Blyttiomyces sp. JEL0837]